jgi:hypothetical protein
LIERSKKASAMTGPVPIPPQPIKKGTNWVEEALNAHQEANILNMSMPMEPSPSRKGLPTEFSEITAL